MSTVQTLLLITFTRKFKRDSTSYRPSPPVGMVRMLGEDVPAMALRNAYAIDMPAADTLIRRHERIAGIRGLSIDTIELYERNMIDELTRRLARGELPVGS